MNIKLILVTIAITFVGGQVYDESQRSDICDRNDSTCVVICYNHNKGTPLTNICDPATLNYECVCSDNWRPPLNNNTLPAATAKCQIEGQECKSKCNGSPQCAEKCNLEHICLGIEEKGSNKTLTNNTSVTITALAPETSQPSLYTDSSATVPSTVFMSLSVAAFTLSIYLL